MKNINHKDSFFLSRKAPTFASGNSNPRIRGMRFLQRKEAKQLVNINYYNGSKKRNKQTDIQFPVYSVGRRGGTTVILTGVCPAQTFYSCQPLTEWISSGWIIK